MKEIKTALKKFLPKIEDAKQRNLNEADTRMRVRLFLSDVLGYDLLDEITQEHMIQSHYVDLTVKLKDKIIFFIEVKAAETTLRETHAYQITNYAATGGVNLCVLTNGIDFRLYYLTWDKAKVESNIILSFNLLEDDINIVAEKLSLLSKESFKKGIIDKYIAEVTSLEDRNLLQALLSKKVLSAIRLELKHITGHKLKEEAIEKSISRLFSADLYDIAKTCLKRKERKSKRRTEMQDQAKLPPEANAPHVPMTVKKQDEKI